MRELLGRVVTRLGRFTEESAWWPLLWRGAAGLAALVLLSVVGLGWLDRSLDLGPPRAAAAAPALRTERRSERSAAPVDSPAPAGSVAPAGSAAAAPPKVVLNTASVEELDRLPGIGPAKARAIVELRTRLGGKFKRFEDLLRVRGIKSRALARIREHAVLDPPVDAAAPSSASAGAAPPPPPKEARQSAPSPPPPW